jgi:hypothetical protein
LFYIFAELEGTTIIVSPMELRRPD